MTYQAKAQERTQKYHVPATSAQTKFLEILLNQLGFSSRLSRNDYLSRQCSREIKFLDDLSKSEASTIISELQARRDHEQNQNRTVNEDDE